MHRVSAHQALVHGADLVETRHKDENRALCGSFNNVLHELLDKIVVNLGLIGSGQGGDDAVVHLWKFPLQLFPRQVVTLSVWNVLLAVALVLAPRTFARSIDRVSRKLEDVLEEDCLDGKCPATNVHDGSLQPRHASIKVSRKELGIERCAHQHKLHLWSPLDQATKNDEKEVRVEVSLMNLVDKDVADTP